MPELTAEQAAEKLRGWNTKVYRIWKLWIVVTQKREIGIFSGTNLINLAEYVGNSIDTAKKLIALAQSQGGEG